MRITIILSRLCTLLSGSGTNTTQRPDIRRLRVALPSVPTPSTGNSNELAVQVLAQKAATVVLVATLLLVVGDVERPAPGDPLSADAGLVALNGLRPLTNGAYSASGPDTGRSAWVVVRAIYRSR